MADITALKGLIPDDQYNALDTALKDNKAKFADLSGGAYVSKEKFDAQAAEVTKLKEQTTAANAQIEEFKKMDVEGIKKAADEWKTKAETSESEWKAKLEKMEFDTALNQQLAAAKAKNPKAVSALLDTSALILKDGKLVGLEDQLKSIQEKESYLFEAAEGTPPPPKFGTPPKGGGGEVSDSLRAAMGLK